ncbi:protein DCL, chloroplastic-like [Dorcoceras hygrometricum]|uniref:Protein DCL, chloroplastic-like n=1 Tax=Dorcoceras hygrometricum TaxID=472368 RepID=A0A2Z7D1N7_9LAMI|nr:protein DCL, chloroplastic-like [Dorcoceras hygrometricum]
MRHPDSTKRQRITFNTQNQRADFSIPLALIRNQISTRSKHATRSLPNMRHPDSTKRQRITFNTQNQRADFSIPLALIRNQISLNDDV